MDKSNSAGLGPLVRALDGTGRGATGRNCGDRVRSQANERRGSSHKRGNNTLGGKPFLAYANHVFEPLNGERAPRGATGHKILQLACGPTPDDILSLPGNSREDMIDMLADQLEHMQNALCYVLLDDNTTDECEPTRAEVWKLREATYRKAGKAPRKQQKAAPLKIKKKTSTSLFSKKDLAWENGEPSDSLSSSESSDSDREDDRRRALKLLSDKPQIDLSLVAATSRERRRESDSEEEASVSTPRRGSVTDSFTAAYVLQIMTFPEAKDNTRLKAKMIADFGKTLGASTTLIELMIKYHTGISISLEILNAYHSLVIGGVDDEAKLGKDLELIKTIGLWPYLAEKATRGWTSAKMIDKLKKLAPKLPGCHEIAIWGEETNWSEISKFAARYDRNTVRIIEPRNESKRGTGYIKPEEWAKLTKEQKQAHVEKRKQNR
ncbi:uncharacterized protein LOC120484914 [Pimephales promelas]|uniref:uncharacterized protein LOC120484914 n=1 Tax=Pimephales promelas TaxID=90988 RepID=UPI00195568C3|nr:uncharacterized protein LOC120484914 [Pimephales promelas]XP_039536294.1 uncharacterized protein LOC120484914 [Pimephales promelas]